MNIDIELLTQALISMLVITAPFDPVKVVLFNKVIKDTGEDRKSAALRISIYVGVILLSATFLGKHFFDFMGIDLTVFGIVGGFIIVLMGFEMMHEGGMSRAQGEDKRQAGFEEGDSILIPLALPLIAGPGAITTAITISSLHGNWLISVICSVVITIICLASFTFFANYIAKAKPRTIAFLVRVGGLLLATIGAQMLLGGVKKFFEMS